MRGNRKVIAFPQQDDGVVGFAEPASRFHDRVEDRLDRCRRAADDIEHLAGGSLVLERFLEIARARLHLVEKAHVLDRDHGLVGERLHQLDLVRREGLGQALATNDNADDLLPAAAGRRRPPDIR